MCLLRQFISEYYTRAHSWALEGVPLHATLGGHWTRSPQEKFTQSALVSHCQPAPHQGSTLKTTSSNGSYYFPLYLTPDQQKILALYCCQTKVPFLNLRSDPRRCYLSEIPDQTMSMLIWVLAYPFLPKVLSSCLHVCQAILSLRDVFILISVDFQHLQVMVSVRAVSRAKDRVY